MPAEININKSCLKPTISSNEKNVAKKTSISNDRTVAKKKPKAFSNYVSMTKTSQLRQSFNLKNQSNNRSESVQTRRKKPDIPKRTSSLQPSNKNSESKSIEAQKSVEAKELPEKKAGKPPAEISPSLCTNSFIIMDRINKLESNSIEGQSIYQV